MIALIGFWSPWRHRTDDVIVLVYSLQASDRYGQLILGLTLFSRFWRDHSLRQSARLLRITDLHCGVTFTLSIPCPECRLLYRHLESKAAVTWRLTAAVCWQPTSAIAWQPTSVAWQPSPLLTSFWRWTAGVVWQLTSIECIMTSC